MNLIQISPNVILNAEHISCIEQTRERGKDVIYVWCNGVKYEYDNEKNAPIGYFISLLTNSGKKEQYFAL